MSAKDPPPPRQLLSHERGIETAPVFAQLRRTATLLTRYYPGWHVSVLAETTSTNQLAKESLRSQTGGTAGNVFLAHHQTAGRGRQGRSWQAEPGCSLLASVAIRSSSLAAKDSGFGRASRNFPPTLWPLQVGLALAFRLRLSGHTCLLKWPNDLVLNDGKVGGILCEKISEGFVAGFGINLLQQNFSPDLASRPVLPPCSLAQSGGGIRAEALIPSLVQAVVSVLEAPWPERKIVEFYSDWCWSLGRRCEGVAKDGSTATGVAFAVASDGALRVETESGTTVELISTVD